MATVVHGYLTGYRNTVSALLARIRELESREYPTALSAALLGTLKGAVLLSSELVEGKHDTAAADLEKIVVLHSALLAYIHELVHLVSRSIGDDVPRWAIAPMKAEIARYLSQSADIMMVGSDEGGNFAYDYRLDGLKGVLTRAFGSKQAEVLTQSLPAQMAVFHFPFGERDNVVAHAAFFHEVGHQIDIGIRGISERVTKDFLTSHDGSIRSAASTLVNTLPGIKANEEEGESVEILVEDVAKAVQSTLWQWAREFCADSLATRILGPVYLVTAVISPAMLSSLERHAPSHPATLLRLRSMLQLLADKEAGDFLGSCAQALQSAGIRDLLDGWRQRSEAADFSKMKWLVALHPLALPNSDLPSATAMWGWELSQAIIRAVASETAQQEYYSPKQYDEDMKDVLPTLQRWITINERINYSTREHRVNSVATIYNVGVSRYLDEPSSVGRNRLNDLLRKSIELSQIHRTVLIDTERVSE